MRIVVLYGKERFLIEEYTRSFAQLLEKKFGGLEQFTFDGESVQPASVLDELRSYGLMQRHKLVILDNAETFLAGRKGADDEEDEESASSGTRRPLMERYAEAPVDDATLLMRAPTWRAGKLDKLILKAGGAIFECDTPNDRAAANWAIKRCEKQHGATLDADAAELLVARMGPELQHLDTELAKLAAIAAGAGQSTITRSLVGQSVGLSREEKAWEIQSAIVTGDASTMLRKLYQQLETSSQRDESAIVPIVWAIIDLLRKLHAGAQLFARGLPPGAVRGQLKLWSDADQILAIASRTKPAILARLLEKAIKTDQANKSGLGDPVRNVEALMIQIADNLGESTNRKAQSANAF